MSVGHVARAFEAEGIPTVVIAIEAFRETLVSMSVPRLVTTPFPLGRPVGFPGNTSQQMRVVREGLRLLEEAVSPHAVRTLDEPYTPNK
ncbi:MAG: hypothetical protein SCK57_05040 [Bacillota bacterium]|nr:hypothetical protein [Bacillota bacterium]